MIFFRHEDGDSYVDFVETPHGTYTVRLMTRAEGMIWEQVFVGDYPGALKRYLLAIVDEAACWGSEVERDGIDTWSKHLR